MEKGTVEKQSNKQATNIDKKFNNIIGKTKTQDVVWLKYGGYLLYYKIRCFFLGEKPLKKNDNKFADLAETLISTIPDNPSTELLASSEKLLEQQRMLEDTRARRRLERWATRVIAYYLLSVFVLLIANGIVLVFNPIETTEMIGNGLLVKRGFISDSIMTVILTTTTINIIGLGVIVLNGHFNKNKDKKVA